MGHYVIDMVEKIKHVFKYLSGNKYLNQQTNLLFVYNLGSSTWLG